MLKVILLIFVTFLAFAEGQIHYGNVTRVHYRYPVLHKDYIADSLTDMGKKMFYAVNIHPSCKAKNGFCVSRASCIGTDMLYISRVCYRHDMVCCYDRTIKFPEVGNKNSDPTTDVTTDIDTNSTTESTSITP